MLKHVDKYTLESVKVTKSDCQLMRREHTKTFIHQTEFTNFSRLVCRLKAPFDLLGELNHVTQVLVGKISVCAVK